MKPGLIFQAGLFAAQLSKNTRLGRACLGRALTNLFLRRNKKCHFVGIIFLTRPF